MDQVDRKTLLDAAIKLDESVMRAEQASRRLLAVADESRDGGVAEVSAAAGAAAEDAFENLVEALDLLRDIGIRP